MKCFNTFGATLAVLALSMLAACGMETAGTAAAVGVTKKNEIEQGRVVQQQVQQQLQQSLDQSRQRADQVDQFTR